MENRKKGVWIGEADLTNDSAFVERAASQEFYELPIVEQLAEDKAMEVGTSRRDFLKYMGFGLGAATVAASCDIPVKRAIPYVVKPDAIVPGVATYYASSYVKGGDYCPIIVKTREGRPIKIEGNGMSSMTKGGTSARAQAMVLELYDTSRFQGPAAVVDGNVAYQKEGKDKKDNGGRYTWAEFDQELGSKMNAGAKVRIITNTVLSPTTKQVFQEFKNKYPNTEVVTYDAISASAILEANQESFGQAVIPNYDFGKADVIASFGADFLGTWISPVEYTAQYTPKRVLKDVNKAKMSRHVQVESYMSLTGSNADNRILIKPSEQGAAIALLANEIVGGVSAPAINEKATAGIKRLAAELKNARGRALVVSGSNNVGEQVLVNAINNALNSYGNTISFENASMQRQGMDRNIQNLIKEMNGGGVDVVFVADSANPAYDLPNSAAFAEAFAKVGTRVTFATKPNETAALCTHIAPTHHTLEAWGDAEPKRGMYSLIQPTIAPLWKTRQMEESLLRWSGSANLNANSDQPYFDYLRATWQRVAFPAQNKFSTFQAFWDSVLHDGVFSAGSRTVAAAPTSEEDATASATPVSLTTTAATAFAGNVGRAASRINKPLSSELEVTFFETVNIGAGEHASNPWLQEMPDPVARTVWGNYLAVPVQYNGGNTWDSLKGLNPDEIYSAADKTKVTVNGIDQVCVAIRQFGQPQNTVALALGYGREVTGKVTSGFGINAFPWLSMDANGNTMYYAGDVNVSTSVGKADLACVQYHHTMGVSAGEDKDFKVDEQTLGLFGAGGYQGALTKRSIIRQTNLSELNEFIYGHGGHHGGGHDDKAQDNDNHHGSMEPTADNYVGLITERKHHQELNDAGLYKGYDYSYEQGHHWGMFVDLNACTGCGACEIACVAENNVPVVGEHEVFRHHEMKWLRIDRYYYGDYENPNVVYQPMMCQHCDNAPCENVCPVAATNHSSEGLNQMTYNRCIGTRYCANNCPYKVRRFNWLDYTTADLFAANEAPLNGEELAFGADNLTRMVLNPDVTVRSRGVIEKCSFCVQRIQEGKLTAKREGRKLRDADVKTACQTACPTGGIVFGDLNDKEGELAKAMDTNLAYQVLEEVNIRPSVTYTAKVVNRDEQMS